MRSKRWFFLLGLLLTGLATLAFTAGQESPPSQGEQIEEFVPSEQVPAGSSVSFPVDI